MADQQTEEAYRPEQEALWVIRFERLGNGKVRILSNKREDNRYGKIRRQSDNILANIDTGRLLLAKAEDRPFFHSIPTRADIGNESVEVLDIVNDTYQPR